MGKKGHLHVYNFVQRYRVSWHQRVQYFICFAEEYRGDAHVDLATDRSILHIQQTADGQFECVRAANVKDIMNNVNNNLVSYLYDLQE